MQAPLEQGLASMAYEGDIQRMFPGSQPEFWASTAGWNNLTTAGFITQEDQPTSGLPTFAFR